MHFPRGITGYWWVGEEPVPQIDVSEFRGLCYAVARELGGTVDDFRIAHVIPNFHSATLSWEYDAKTVDLLCNRQHWIIAFAKPRVETDWFLEFVDCPEITELIRSMWDRPVLSKAKLETPLNDDHLAEMAPTDREIIEDAQRRRWFGRRPTIGDVVFHFSD